MRGTWRCFVPAAVACALALCVSAGAQDAPVLSHDFEQNDGGWQGAGGAGIVSVTHDPALVKSGKGSMQFAYTLKKGEFALAILPTPDMVLAKTKSFRFWIRTDHTTSFSFVAQEKDGGRYNAAFSIPKGAWQQVELSTADFVIDHNGDAPKDPDGKLDMDQVENIGLIDVAQLFIQGDPALATAFGVSEGPRTFWLDDFAAVTTTLIPATTLKAGDGLIDTFARPQIGWIAAGDVQLSKTSGKPLEGAGVQARYHQGPARIAGLTHFIAPGALAGATSLSLSAASLKPAKIVVQVEERSGGKYNTIVELPGNSGRADVTVKFADFKPAQDSKDDNGMLDLDQATQILLLDGSGLLENTDADNILWVNNIKATK